MYIYALPLVSFSKEFIEATVHFPLTYRFFNFVTCLPYSSFSETDDDVDCRSETFLFLQVHSPLFSSNSDTPLLKFLELVIQFFILRCLIKHKVNCHKMMHIYIRAATRYFISYNWKFRHQFL